jgi:hemerythrin-like domain-containing protein
MEKDNNMTDISPLVGGLLRIHKIITRGLSVSLPKCDEYLGKKGIPSGEEEGFSKYLSTLKWVMHAHHLSEDDIAFPYFKEHLEAPYSRLQDDHHAMARLLDKLDQCLSDLTLGGVGRLRAVLDELNKLWGPHIKIEEEHFTPAKVQVAIGMKEQLNLVEKLEEHSIKNSGPGPLGLPFMVYNLEGKDREAFVKPIPWIAKKVLVPIVWKSQWKPMSPFFL